MLVIANNEDEENVDFCGGKFLKFFHSVVIDFLTQVHVRYDPETGEFAGMPRSWELLLQQSQISKQEQQQNPQAVLNALKYFTRTEGSGQKWLQPSQSFESHQSSSTLSSLFEQQVALGNSAAVANGTAGDAATMRTNGTGAQLGSGHPAGSKPKNQLMVNSLNYASGSLPHSAKPHRNGPAITAAQGTQFFSRIEL